MTKGSLKSVALKGMLWSAADKFAGYAGQFIIGIVLARLLMPEDFGLIGMLSIFIAISQSFIDSGMGSGLIQKINRSEADFSTVFVFNFTVSVFFYIILYFSAPFIAAFYNMPQLVLLTRVVSINIVLNSLAIVQRSKLTINIDFKTIAKVNLASVISGGIVGVCLAYIGFGYWSLVIQNLVGTIVSVVMLWLISKWKPSILFSKESFRELFGFGSKLLAASLYSQIFNNIYNITIGKYYAAAELGYYTRTKMFAELTAGTVTSVLQQVTFPLLSSLKEDRIKMGIIFGKVVRMSAFFIIPSMTMLALLADPFIRLVLTEKWLPVVSLLQWMCFARIFLPMSVVNMNILNAMGRSDLFLKVDLSKFPLAVLALVITIPLGVKAMVIGHVIVSFLAYLINSYLPGKYFGYGPISQLKDMLPVILNTLVMALAVYISIFFIEIMWLKLIIGGIVGCVFYFAGAFILKMEELTEVMLLIKKIR